MTTLGELRHLIQHSLYREFARFSPQLSRIYIPRILYLAEKQPRVFGTQPASHWPGWIAC